MHLAQTFIILAETSKYFHEKSKKPSKDLDHAFNILDSQKIRLKICNYLTIALELSILCKNAILIKRILTHFHNHLTPFFDLHCKSPLLLHCLLKSHCALLSIPHTLSDSTTRKLSSSPSFQLLTLCLQTQEPKLAHRILNNDLLFKRRNWLIRIDKTMVPKPKVIEDAYAEEDKEKEGNEDEEHEIIFEEQVNEWVEECELEGAAFEQWLMQIVVFEKYAGRSAQKWSNLLSRMLPKTQSEEAKACVMQMSEQIAKMVEFWASIKDSPSNALQTLQVEGDVQSSKYLEYSCKGIRRMLQQKEKANEAVILKAIEDVQVDKFLFEEIEKKLAEKEENLQNDVVKKQIRRFELLEERFNRMDATTESFSKYDASLLRDGLKKQIEQERVDEILRRKTHRAKDTNRMVNLKWVSEYYYLRSSVIISSLLVRKQILFFLY